MKKYSCLILLALFVGACSEDIIPIRNGEIAETRAIVGGDNLSISNPDLINNWENIDKIVLNTSGEAVTAPWADGTTSPLSEAFRKDVKKEDGWEMLCHTFKEVGLDPKQNYMFLYNHFTGVVKIFYYYEGNIPHQGTQWYIMTTDGANVKMLDAPEYLAKTDSDPANNNKLFLSNAGNTPVSGIEPGWNGFEFQISRYSTDLTHMDFTIGAYDQRIISYDFLGKAALESEGTVTTTSSSSTGLSRSIANLMGAGAKEYIDKMANNSLGEVIVLDKKLSDLIASIPKSGYVSVFQQGLDKIFGRTTTSSSQNISITTLGTVSVFGTGSSEVTAGIPPLSFDLYGLLNPTSSQINSHLVTAPSETTGEHHLGVWTLKEDPTIYYDRIVQVPSVKVIGSAPGDQALVEMQVALPQITHCDFEAILNPDVREKILNHSFSVKYVIAERGVGANLTHEIGTVFEKKVLYSDTQRELLELPSAVDRYSKTITVSATDVRTGAAFWYDWGKIIDGNVLAIISLDLSYSSSTGEVKNIHQSKVFPVKYGVDSNVLQPEDVFHRPYSILLNPGYPYTQATWGWR